MAKIHSMELASRSEGGRDRVCRTIRKDLRNCHRTWLVVWPEKNSNECKYGVMLDKPSQRKVEIRLAAIEM